MATSGFSLGCGFSHLDVIIGCSGFSYTHGKEGILPQRPTSRGLLMSGIRCKGFSRSPSSSARNWRPFSGSFSLGPLEHSPAGNFSLPSSTLFCPACFEFRHDSWMVPQVFDLCRRHNVCLCMADSLPFIDDLLVTADFVCVRKHGQAARRSGRYAKDQLAADEERIRAWRTRG